MTTPSQGPGQAPPQPITLWHTDRSRYETGILHCKRQRFLRYHAGNHGYGWDLQAQAMPTVTGTLVHDPVLATLAYVRDHAGAIPDPAWVYQEAILPAIDKYTQIVITRGLQQILDPQELGLRAVEQCTLLEGLTWCWYYTALPSYAAQYEVVLIEEEAPVVLGCTCGLGEALGAPVDHDARGCEGIVYMTRGDAIAQHKLTGTYRYDEFKTTSDARQSWEEAWQYRAQVLTGVLGAEARLGVLIDEVWIHGLIKGSFRAGWDPAEQKAVGPKYQQSPLVYGWRRPANPGLYAENWELTHKLPPDPVTGKGKKLGKDYERTGIWEMPAEAWQVAEGLQSVGHFWALALQERGLLAEQYKAVGPIMREASRLQHCVRQIVGEEQRVRRGVWAVYDALTASDGDWSAPAVGDALDAHFPQSGGDACHSYFGHPCPYVRVCWKGERPEDGPYVPRRPHHQPELDQMIARGLALPAVGAAEDAEE